MQNTISILPLFVYTLLPDDRRAVLATLANSLERGLLHHTVARTLPLEDIAKAHELLERGEVIGSVVLDV